VATFCHNIARGLPVKVNDGNAALTLVYVDDVVDEFIRVLRDKPPVGTEELCCVPVEYQTTVGEMAGQIESFRDSRASLVSERVGAGLVRALYSTYMSYLLPIRLATKCPSMRMRVAYLSKCSRPRIRGSSHSLPLTQASRVWALSPFQDRKIPDHQRQGAFWFPTYLTDETHVLLLQASSLRLWRRFRVVARHYQCG